MSKMYYFPTPLNATGLLRSDATGIEQQSVPDTHPGGRPGISWEVPTAAIGVGAALTLSAASYDDLFLRGIIYQTPDGFLYLLNDDAHLHKTTVCPDPVPPTPIPPPTGGTPQDIILRVYATGQYTLLTKEGCGQFTEACCTALHNEHSDQWGHIRKMGAQNQYNGHAVDAVQLLVPVGTFRAGIYDIIVDSESVNAHPACNRAGDAIPALWYYPA